MTFKEGYFFSDGNYLIYFLFENSTVLKIFKTFIVKHPMDTPYGIFILRTNKDDQSFNNK